MMYNKSKLSLQFFLSVVFIINSTLPVHSLVSDNTHNPIGWYLTNDYEADGDSDGTDDIDEINDLNATCVVRYRQATQDAAYERLYLQAAQAEGLDALVSIHRQDIIDFQYARFRNDVTAQANALSSITDDISLILATPSPTNLLGWYIFDEPGIIIGGAGASFDPDRTRSLEFNLMCTGDFDGDGVPEIAAHYGTGDNIFIIEANGGDTTDIEVYPTTNPLIAFMCVGNFDTDAADELAFASASGDFIRVLNIDESVIGSFDLFPEPGTNATITHMTAGDYDGDGVDELAFNSDGGSWIKVVESTGGTPLASYELFPESSSFINHMISGDFDGDGADELAFNSGGADWIKVVEFSGTSSLASYDLFGAPNPTIKFMKAGNFDADDSDELVFGVVGDDEITTCEYDGTNRSSFDLYSGTNPAIDYMVIADYDGDGIDELCLTTDNNDNRIHTTEINGTALSEFDLYGRKNVQFAHVLAADFDGDGIAELCFNSAGGDWIKITEATVITPSTLRMVYDEIKATDPNHDVFLVVCEYDVNLRDPNTDESYAAACDVAMYDEYPCDDGDPALTDSLLKVPEAIDALQNMIDHDGRDISLMMVLQGQGAPDWEGRSNPWGNRAATYEESRYMTYISILKGATGILYWAYYRSNTSASTVNADVTEEIINNNIIEIVESAITVNNVYCSYDGLDANGDGYNDIQYVFRQRGGNHYLIAVSNRDVIQNNVIFELPFNIATVKVLEEEVAGAQRYAQPFNNTFSDDFGPFEVHAYQISIAQGELAVTSGGYDWVKVFEYDGTGLPGGSYGLFSGKDPVINHMVAGDYDGDGIDELAFNSENGDWIKVVEFDGTPLASYDIFPSSSNSITGMISGDFDGDGEDEVAVNTNNSDYISIHDYDGTVISDFYAWYYRRPIKNLTAGDFDGDGVDEIGLVAQHSYNNMAVLILVEPNGSKMRVQGYSGYNYNNFLAAGDFNDDGVDEIAINYGAYDNIKVINRLGSTLAQYELYSGQSSSHTVQNMVSGDFNGDGQDDLAFSTGGYDWIKVVEYNGAGLSSHSMKDGNHVVSQMLAYDFNSDGADDLAFNYGFNDYFLVSEFDGTVMADYKLYAPSTTTTIQHMVAGNFASENFIPKQPWNADPVSAPVKTDNYFSVSPSPVLSNAAISYQVVCDNDVLVPVDITMFSEKGELLDDVYSGYQGQGTYKLNWQVPNILKNASVSNIIICRIRIGDKVQAIKILNH